MVGDMKWYTDMRKIPDIRPGLHSKVHVQQRGSVKRSITVNTLKIWHFQRSDMQVRCTTQPFADRCFANEALQGQKQIRKTSEARGSLDDCLWNPSVGSRLCASLSFSVMFSFQVWSTVYLCLFWSCFFFSFEHCVLASQGSRAMGAQAKKKHL